MSDHYKFFSHKQCEYYPCHQLDEINCLFCYCPLYILKDCKGNYKMIGDIKDCSGPRPSCSTRRLARGC